MHVFSYIFCIGLGLEVGKWLPWSSLPFPVFFVPPPHKKKPHLEFHVIQTHIPITPMYWNDPSDSEVSTLAPSFFGDFSLYHCHLCQRQQHSLNSPSVPLYYPVCIWTSPCQWVLIIKYNTKWSDASKLWRQVRANMFPSLICLFVNLLIKCRISKDQISSVTN